MYLLREYTGFAMLVFFPLTVLFAACTAGYLLTLAARKLTRVIVNLALRKQPRCTESASTKLARIQPPVIVAARMEA